MSCREAATEHAGNAHKRKSDGAACELLIHAGANLRRELPLHERVVAAVQIFIARQGYAMAITPHRSSVFVSSFVRIGTPLSTLTTTPLKNDVTPCHTQDERDRSIPEVGSGEKIDITLQ